MLNELCIWSLITEKYVTLQELESHWSLDDVMRFHGVIEMKNDLIEETNKQAKREKPRGNR